MRISVHKLGGGVDTFTTNPDDGNTIAKRMTGYSTLPYGLRIELDGRDSRTYPWTSIMFVEMHHNA